MTRRLLGDAIYLRVPGNSLLILDSAEAANQLLEKRAEIYSDRIQFIMWKLYVPSRLSRWADTDTRRLT